MLSPLFERVPYHTNNAPLKILAGKNEVANSLPIPQKPHPLCGLTPEIRKMAREQQVILRRHRHRVTHEHGRVQCQRRGHATGYPKPPRR